MDQTTPYRSAMVIKAPSQYIKATQCLFDMDGLLINTEDMYTAAANALLEPYGKSFSWALKVQCMGLRDNEAAALFLKETEIPLSIQEYHERRRALQEELFPKCQPMPGALELVKHLHGLDFPIALATSSYRRAYLVKAENNMHLFDLFGDKLIFGESVANSKPAPDAFLEASRLLPSSGTDTCVVVFEDSVLGVQAGLAAGMHVVWVRDERLAAAAEAFDAKRYPVTELESRCFAVLNSLDNFDPEWIGIPPYISSSAAKLLDLSEVLPSSLPLTHTPTHSPHTHQLS